MKIVTRQELMDQKVDQVESTSSYITVTELPSKFLSYPDNVKIQYKPYSFGELESWSNINSGTPVKDRFDLALQGIKIEGMHPYELALADYLYIMTLRKLSSYENAKFNLTYYCPHCNNKVTTTKDLMIVEFKDFEEFESLPIEYKCSDGKILVIDTMKLHDVIRFKESGLQDNAMNRIAFQIRNIDSIEESLDFITNLTDKQDIVLLVELENILNFGKSQEVDLECPHCKKQATISISGVSALAEPFRESKSTLRDRILSGKTSHS